VVWEESCQDLDEQCRDEAVAEFQIRNNTFGYVRRGEFEDFDIGELPPYEGCLHCYGLAGGFGVLFVICLVIVIVSGKILCKGKGLPPTIPNQTMTAKQDYYSHEMKQMNGRPIGTATTAAVGPVPSGQVR